jgi:hypothetical protein
LDNGFEQFITRFQTFEVASQHQRHPFILADANARPIDIDLATADALPAFKDFSHCIDPAFLVTNVLVTWTNE